MLAVESGVDIVLIKDGYVNSCLDNDPTPGVHKEFAALAAKQGLWGNRPLYPSHSCRVGATYELFGHARSMTAGTSELSIEDIVSSLRRRQDVLVPFNGESGDLWIEFLDRSTVSNEILEGRRVLSHSQRVA